MKEPEVTEKWIAAGKLLGVHPEAKVPCPVCAQENLGVMDIAIAGTRKFERLLSCSKCHSWNALLMNKKD
jgi:hypothetical protein